MKQKIPHDRNHEVFENVDIIGLINVLRIVKLYELS